MGILIFLNENKKMPLAAKIKKEEVTAMDIKFHIPDFMHLFRINLTLAEYMRMRP